MNPRRLAAFIAAITLIAAHAAHAKSLTADEVWSGKVKVEGQVVVEKGATLTIEPGTKVMFLPGKLDEEGLADSGLVVKGAIVAKGQPGSRIEFTSGATARKRGDWGEVKLIASEGSSVEYCDFSYGGWGLHVHDSKLTISRCTFTNNLYGGIRGIGGEVEIAFCMIRGLDVGIRYWKGAPSIHHNNITGNGTGIFCRQDMGGAVICLNNIYSNTEYDIKLGDMQKEDVNARRNWWGTTDIARIRNRIYDKSREGYIGRVLIEPVLQKEVAIK
jgi:hypothetical protein